MGQKTQYSKCVSSPQIDSFSRRMFFFGRWKIIQKFIEKAKELEQFFLRVRWEKSKFRFIL